VITVAVAKVREQQNALADYRRSVQNVKGQMDAATREQEITTRQTIQEVSQTFAESIRRGREAIHDIFQLSRVVALAIGGIMELLGLAGLVRRLGASTPARTAFEARKVSEPLDELPAIIDRLGPRLEGRDIKDIDDLIAYTRGEIARLPAALQQKVVGKLEAPATYDRAVMRDARAGLIATLDKARSVEFQRIDRAVHNWLIVIGAYEIVLIIAAVVAAISLSGSQNANWLLLLLIVIVLALVGMALIPLRGTLMEQAYGRRMLGVEAELEQAIDRAAQQQIKIGSQLRADAIAPFLRLVEAQVSHVDELKKQLDSHEQGLVALEKELGGLRE
jgi:hypothetical protein